MQSVEPKISIVIPAYNAEKTVEETVRNVLASTIPVRVYVVDDGSVDGTLSILKRIEADVKIKGVGVEWNGSSLTVVHQENTGAYQARLNALKQISTPYFGFVDADDTVEPEMFERMVAACETNNLDCVQCKIADLTPLHLHLDTTPLKIISEDDLEAHKFRYLVNPREACYIWDKVYRNQYDFAAFELTDRITNFDDMVFNFQFFRQINRMGFLDEGLYHYATTEGSAVHRFGPRQRHDFMWMVKNHWRFCTDLLAGRGVPRVRLWLGHLEWLWVNMRSATIALIRGWLR